MHVETPKVGRLHEDEAYFCFFPEIHRFFIQSDSGISEIRAQKMIEGLFETHVTEINKTLVVDIVKSRSEIDELFEAKRVLDLELSISYSNGDYNEGAKKYMDDSVNEMNAIQLSLTAKSSNRSSDPGLNINQPILNGAIQQSVSDGTLKATVETALGEIKVLDSSEKPEIVKLRTADASNFPRAIFEAFSFLFR
jgi:hypothetical protein